MILEIWKQVEWVGSTTQRRETGTSRLSALTSSFTFYLPVTRCDSAITCDSPQIGLARALPG